jgi:phosphatidylinositol alpha-1,6-mannosyltransferase
MQARLQVLLLTPDFPPAIGGIQLLLNRLTAHLDAEVRVVTLATPGPHAGPAQDATGDGEVVVRRVRALGTHRVNVVGLNVAAMSEAAGRAPHVILSGHIVTSPAAAMLARRWHIPYVQYLYGAEVTRRDRLARFAVSHADAVLVVSAYTATLALAAGARSDRVFVVHPGVDQRARSKRPRDTTPHVVTVARLADLYKGHDTILRASSLVAARVPGARWIVVGGGPLLAQYRSWSGPLAASPTVELVGAVGDKERDEWLDRAHVFSLTSRGGGGGGEGFGIVYLEAGLHSLPVVAGAVGGALDAVVDGETGLLVDPTDHVAVADAVTRLLVDQDLSRRLGQAGRRRAQTFTWERMADGVNDVLTRTAAAARAA